MSQGNLALQHLGLTPLSQEMIENIHNLSDFFISHAVSQTDTPIENITTKLVDSEPLDLYSLFLADFHNFSAYQAKSENEIIEY